MNNKIMICCFSILTSLLFSCDVMINPTPEISVFDESNNLIPNNVGSYDYGELIVNNNLNAIFYIGNTGSTKLRLDGSPIISITGQGASAFQVALNPYGIIKVGDIVPLRITFAPKESGSFTATVTIQNNDLDESDYSFTIKGRGINPAINVYDSSSKLIYNNGTFDFGKIRFNKIESESFKIVNDGTSILQLTGNPRVEISCSTPNIFRVSVQPVEILVPSKSSNFVIECSSSIEGSFSCTVTIPNSVVSENPYVFTIKAEFAEPEIKVTDANINEMKSWLSTFSFGNVLLNTNVTATFTIHNIGTDILKLSGNPRVSISGSGANCYKVISLPESTVSVGDKTNFTIQFIPTLLTMFNAEVSIDNNDSDENPFVFFLAGTGVAPEINVKLDTLDLISGSTIIDFGSIYDAYSSSLHTFTIENIGSSNLHLTGSPKIAISGSGSAMFDINQSMTTSEILPNGTTTFTITFKPTADGNFEASISIANDDSNENPFTFVVKGVGLAQNPDINVCVGIDDIPNSTGVFNFEEIKVGNSSQPVTFTIENLGVKVLQLTGSPVVEMTGAYISEFTLNISSTSSSIQPNGSTTFTVTYNPVSCGIKPITITIKNNDPDENPYTFTINGITTLESDFNGDGIQDMVIGARYDDDGGNNSGCGFIFFGKQNWSSTLTPSNADVKLIGENEGDTFGCTVSSIGDVNGDGYDDIAVGAINNDAGGNNAGSVYLFFGRRIWNSAIDASNADVKLIGMDAGDLFGISITKAIDINNDDIDDVIVGARNDDDGGSASGCVFVFYGRKTWTSSIDASNASIRIVGADSGDSFGCSVSFAGDVNGDNYDDLIVGAEGDNDGGSRSGCAFIFFGKQNLSSNIDASNADVKLVGEDSGDCFGASVSYVGDVNDDNYDDLIVGAYRDKDKGYESGCAFVFFGRQNWSSSIDASNASIKFTGSNDNDRLGFCVSYSSDLNNDGIDDIVISAPEDSNSANYSGSIFIYWGKKNWSSLYDASNADVKIIGQNYLDRIGICLTSAGDINNDGIDDIIISAPYRTTVTYSEGSVYIVYGKNNWSSSFSITAADIEIKSVTELDQLGSSVSGN